MKMEKLIYLNLINKFQRRDINIEFIIDFFIYIKLFDNQILTQNSI